MNITIEELQTLAALKGLTIDGNSLRCGEHIYIEWGNGVWVDSELYGWSVDSDDCEISEKLQRWYENGCPVPV